MCYLTADSRSRPEQMIADSANLYHPPNALQVPEVVPKSRRRNQKKEAENASRPTGVSSSDSSSSLSDSDSEKKLQHSLPADGAFNGDGASDSGSTSAATSKRGTRPDAPDKLGTLREELVESGIYSKPPTQTPPPAPQPEASPPPAPAVPPPPPPRRSLQSAQSHESHKSSGSPAAAASEQTDSRRDSMSSETPTRSGSSASRPPRPPPPRADSIARARDSSISSPSAIAFQADTKGSGSAGATSNAKNVFTFSEEETGRPGPGAGAGPGAGGLSSRVVNKISSKLPPQITQQLSSIQKEIGEIASRPEAQKLQQNTRHIVSQVTDVAAQIRDAGQANLNDLLAGGSSCVRSCTVPCTVQCTVYLMFSYEYITTVCTSTRTLRALLTLRISIIFFDV